MTRLIGADVVDYERRRRVCAYAVRVGTARRWESVAALPEWGTRSAVGSANHSSWRAILESVGFGRQAKPAGRPASPPIPVGRVRPSGLTLRGVLDLPRSSDRLPARLCVMAPARIAWGSLRSGARWHRNTHGDGEPLCLHRPLHSVPGLRESRRLLTARESQRRHRLSRGTAKP